MQSTPKTIIELSSTLDSLQEDKLKQLLEIVFDIAQSDVNIYDSKHYATESEFANEIAEEIMENRADDALC